MSELKILLLEDNDNDAQLVKHQLDDLNLLYAFKHANNEIEFKSILKQEWPDIVLSDQILPTYDGFSAFLELKKSQIDIPFILISGRITQETTKKVADLGISDYVDKKNLNRLPQSIRRAIHYHERKNTPQAKKAEQEYLTENRFRLLADNSTDMISSHSIDGVYTYVSPICLDILGYQQHEVLGQSAYKFIHPEDIKTIEKEHLAMLENKSKVKADYRLKKKDGSYAWMESTSQPILNRLTGEIIEIVVITRDITDRIAKEEKLKRAESLLSEAQRLAEMGNWSYGLNDNEAIWSGNLRTMYGVDSDVTPSFNLFLSFVHPEDRKQVEQKLSHAMKVGGKYEQTYRIIKTNGEICCHHSITTFELNADKKPIRVFGISRDITAELINEAKLAKTEKLLSEAQQIAHIGSWNYDVVKNETLWSEEMYRIYGMELHEKIHSRVYVEYTHPDDLDGMEKAIHESLKTDKPAQFYHRIKTKNGLMRMLHTQVRIEKSAEGKPIRIFGTTQDITEQQTRDKKLSQTEQLLEEAQNLAHFGNWNFDLRTNEIFWSKGLRKIYGLNENDQINYEKFLSYIHPEDAGRVKKNSMNTQFTGQPADHKFRIKRTNGEMRILHDIIKAEVNANGEVIRMFGTSQDITELETAQNELKQTLAELELRVEKRTLSLRKTNNQLKEQITERILISKQLEEKNKAIVESITYAKRLQKAVLPDLSAFSKEFEGGFVLNKPKDIVSGDFWWTHKARKKTMVAVCDCTGHGVPGAFMSLLGAEALNKTVIVNEWKHPSLVLELLDAELCATLNRHSDEVNDGMDISFCTIDHVEKKISYAGAVSPIIIYRLNGDLEIYKGSRFSLGGYLCSSKKKFETIDISYEKGDKLYMFSDGFQDQFGGDKNKKLKFSAFAGLIAQANSLPIKSQSQFLDGAFENWKGKNLQIDDVLLIGLTL